MRKLDVSRLLGDFEAEAKVHIEEIEAAFLAPGLIDTELMNSVFRAAHSLKGTAGFYSLKDIVAVSHELESLFARIRDGKLQIDEKIADSVLKSVDKLKDLIADIHNKSGEVSVPFDFTGIEVSLKSARKHGMKVYHVRLDNVSDKILESVGSVGNIIQRIDGELLVASVLEQGLLAAALEVEAEQIRALDLNAVQKSPEQVKNTEKDSNQLIRLPLTVIDNIMDLANEMILTRNQLNSTVSAHMKSIPGLGAVLYDINRLTGEVQEKIMFTRMQPVSVIFDKFPRMIRDTAKLLGKDIALKVSNNDVTLDKYLLEALADPVTQIVRNSAVHGLESPALRVKLGKPAKGTITLDSFMQDGSAVIEITDDGCGIDIGTIKQKALDLELVTKEALSAMSEKEAFSLVFEPGVSTSEEITDLSGRGFGMSIVKTNIEKLKGSVEIESRLGKGTCIRLIMPLTLSVIRTLIVTVDSTQYAVPDLNVERIVRVNDYTPSRRIERVNKSLVLILDGRIIPVVTMNEIDAKAKAAEPVSADKLLEQYRHGGIVKCLILRAGGKSFALLIDNATDTEQVLVKPLPIYLQNIPCYSNVTVLGNGSAVTILDAEGIMRYMRLDVLEKEAAELIKTVAEEKAEDVALTGDRKHVIIFKCSGTEYFAAEIDDVSRIEQVNPGEIQTIGSGNFVGVNGRIIRVVRPEDYTPVQKHDYNGEKLYMLILKSGRLPVGLLVQRVIDKYDDVFAVDEERFCNSYIHGTSIYNKKMVIFLNTAAVAEAAQSEEYICTD